MRPNRTWRPLVEPATDIIESHFRNTSIDRITLPCKIRRLIKSWSPDAVLAWTPKGCKLMIEQKGCNRIMRLGDYPKSLDRFKNVDIIVANTPDIVHRVKQLGWRKPAIAISNFTSTRRASSVDLSKLGIDPAMTIVSSMGRFVARKGFDVLIRAIAKQPQTHLLLIGDGEEKTRLRQLANELGVSHRVSFLGWQLDPLPNIASSDIFVLPSNHEPLGNVILEAWAQGIPVISTRSEGPQWFMENGQNGLLVDVGDDTGLASAIKRLSTDFDLRSKVVDGGAYALSNRFSEQNITSKYIDLIQANTVL